MSSLHVKLNSILNLYHKGVWNVHASVQLTCKAESFSLRFDKVFGMFMTKNGKVRRMDLIITPLEEYPFCLLGWTGSKQYLRFLRQHAGNCGMYLNSHRQAQESHAADICLTS